MTFYYNKLSKNVEVLVTSYSSLQYDWLRATEASKNKYSLSKTCLFENTETIIICLLEKKPEYEGLHVRNSNDFGLIKQAAKEESFKYWRTGSQYQFVAADDLNLEIDTNIMIQIFQHRTLE